MKKLWTGGMLLLGFCLPQAQGQAYYRPNTNPYVRPQLSPYFNYYYGTPNPFVAPGGVGVPGFGTGLPYSGTGLPGAGVVLPDQTGRTTLSQTTPGQEGTQNITGHPTRFFSYSQYFFNQGAGGQGSGYYAVPGTATTTPGSPGGAFAIVGGTGSTHLGAPPPRGRGNITQPRTRR